MFVMKMHTETTKKIRLQVWIHFLSQFLFFYVMLLCDQDIKLGFHSLCSAFGTRQTWGWWASTQNRARSEKNRKLTGHIEDSNSCKVNMWQGRRNTGRGISWDEKILMFVMSNESWKVSNVNEFIFITWIVQREGKKEKHRERVQKYTHRT